MKIAILLISIYLGCSCARKTAEEALAIPLSINIASLGRGTSPLPDGSEVGIFVGEDSPENNYDGQAYQNIRSVVTGGQLKLDEEVMLNSTSASVYAYYPYDASYTNPRKIRVSAKSTKTPDFLTAKVEGINNFNPNVNLVMQHMYSIVRVKLRNLSGKIEYAKPHAILLRNNTESLHMNFVGDVDLKFCNIVPATIRVPAINIPLNGSYEITDSFPGDIDAIDFQVIPMTVDEGGIAIDVTFKNGFTKRTFQIPAGNWEVGTITTYNLTISQ